jgi:hypothetical protein
MATRYAVLAQAAPSLTTNTTLYTVPSGKDVILSTLIIANRENANASYRIAIRPAAETLADKHYIAYDVAVGARDSTALTLGITLTATDVITIFASTANLSFSAFGSVVDI